MTCSECGGDYTFKKGDVVKVWSLQSFSFGGFLNGAEAVVSQDQNSGSVLVTVARNFRGDIRLDPSYEVYPQQLRLVRKASEMPADLVARLALLVADAKKERDGRQQG